MRNKDGKITIKSIWKWLKSDKGKRYSFFIFYLFFFLILFIYLTIIDSQKGSFNNQNNQGEIESLPFKISSLETNYSFKYSLITNNQIKEYLGKKDNLKITLQDDTGIYSYNYVNNDLIKDDSNNLNLYYEFLDIYNFKKLVKNSKYISKTEYSNKEVSYNYVVTNQELNEYFNLETLNLDLENSLIIKTDSFNNLKEFELDLLNFVNDLNDTKDTSYKIVITYEAKNE